MCVVRKKFPTLEIEYFMKLNALDIEKIIKRKNKGVSSVFIAKQFNISKRRVNQLLLEFKKTGLFPVLQKNGTKPKRVYPRSLERRILSLHSKLGFGANYIAQYLRKKENFKIANNYVHSVLLANNKALANPKKQKRRKPWVRYEKPWSLDMVHMDWHYNSHLQMWMCAVLDDKSRKILCGGEFKKQEAKHNIGLIKQVYKTYLHIRPIDVCLTDRGSQFYANKQKGKRQGISEFQRVLARLKITHSKCRYKHPQTNGKFEKWNHTYELHRQKFNSFNEFMDWYNHRPHGSLDFDMPEQVFWRELMPWTLGSFIKMRGENKSGKKN